jgi:hypothetical protein
MAARMRAVLATLVVFAAFAGVGASNAAALCDPNGCGGGGGGGSVTTHTLTVTVSGQGSVSEGTAAGTCTRAQGQCSFVYLAGDGSTFTATPATGWHLDHWGECTGTSTCDVVMSSDKTLTAVFAPNTPTINGPAAGSSIVTTNGGMVTVSFTGGTGANQSAQCSTNGSTWQTCTSESTAVGPYPTGTVTIYVRAIDSDSNVSDVASRSIKVVNLPDTSIGGTPAAGATVASTSTAFTYSASFAYVGSNPTPGFQCNLDGVALAVCPADGDVGPLADGVHTLSVRATVNPFGNPVPYGDATPATRTWTVDATAPTVSITAGPANGSSTAGTAADFRFTTSEGTFECSLDSATFAPCPGPAADQASYSGLAAGSHTFSVRAHDTVGNAGTATRSWTITAPPAVTDPNSAPDGNTAGTPVGSGSGTENTNGNTTGNTQTAGSSPAAASIKVTVASKWSTTKKGTKALKLLLSTIPEGARIAFSCKGKSCPFKTKNVTPANGKADLMKLLKKRLLKKGTVLEIRVTKPGMTGQVLRFTVQPPKQPKKATLSS